MIGSERLRIVCVNGRTPLNTHSLSKVKYSQALKAFQLKVSCNSNHEIQEADELKALLKDESF